MASVWPNGPNRKRRTLAVSVKVAAGLFMIMLSWTIPFSITLLRVSGDSMADTLRDGNVVIVLKRDRFDWIIDLLKPLRAGSVVIIRDPISGRLAVKRIVAVGGERLRVEDGVILVNGRPRRFSNIARTSRDTWPTVSSEPALVPEGRFFVVGDSLSWSGDSRVFGPIRPGDVLGTVLNH